MHDTKPHKMIIPCKGAAGPPKLDAQIIVKIASKIAISLPNRPTYYLIYSRPTRQKYFCVKLAMKFGDPGHKTIFLFLTVFFLEKLVDAHAFSASALWRS